jgi:hypothetical protein
MHPSPKADTSSSLLPSFRRFIMVLHVCSNLPFDNGVGGKSQVLATEPKYAASGGNRSLPVTASA